MTSGGGKLAACPAAFLTSSLASQGRRWCEVQTEPGIATAHLAFFFCFQSFSDDDHAAERQKCPIFVIISLRIRRETPVIA